MMRLWRESYAKPALGLLVAGAAFSTLTHATLISAWVVATLPAAGMPYESLANRPFYIPPPPRVFGSRLNTETVQYIALGNHGTGVGEGPRTLGFGRPSVVDETSGRGKQDTAAVQPPPKPVAHDSIFTVEQVDTAVVRMSNSAAPAYPLDLLAKHIIGSVVAEYVVDTTGFADMESFTVLRASNPGFIDAVKEALPYMRFSPAKIGSTKVRQRVSQEFGFRIANAEAASPSTAAAATAKRKP